MSENDSGYLRRALELMQPAFLGGFTFPQWLRLLHKNRWKIDAKYLPRAVIATCGTIATSLLKPFEPSAELDEYCEKLWQRPIFILGPGRSGTTHLFHLLASDPRLCFPTRLDCDNPHTFLILRRLGLHRLLGMIPAKKRYMDNVQTGWLSPSEDSVALAILTASGHRLRHVFPKTCGSGASAHHPWCHGDGPDPQFEEALTLFSRKLVFLHKRRPVFKSPSHTRAIPQICKVFPEAKFVTILRDPFSQFSSVVGFQQSKTMQWSTLQKPSEFSDEMRLGMVASTLQRYLDTRSAIPEENLIEIKYNELVSDQVGTLKKIYSMLRLDLPPHLGQPPSVNYERNKHPALTPELKARVREVYQPFVAAGLFDSSDLS
jgi:hypothetical protein